MSRLPQRVYWTRRALVLGVALIMVFGIAKLLGSGGGGNNQDASRATTSADRTTPSSTPRVAGPTTSATGQSTIGTKRAPAVPLATPSGPCAADQVVVTPTLVKAAAGGRISVGLSLTGTQPACTFTVSPQTVVLAITSGSDRIWSSQDCPRAIPNEDVVVRSAVPATVAVSWSGRRSDPACSNSTRWAVPGYYHATAAALGSTPTDAQFRLVLPKRPVVTRTTHPKPKKQPTTTPTSKPTTKPTGRSIQ